jgi:hypothetical protein
MSARHGSLVSASLALAWLRVVTAPVAADAAAPIPGLTRLVALRSILDDFGQVRILTPYGRRREVRSATARIEIDRDDRCRRNALGKKTASIFR